jgi:hypothetical protein
MALFKVSAPGHRRPPSIKVSAAHGQGAPRSGFVAAGRRTPWPFAVATLLLAVAVLYGCSSTPVPTDPVTSGCSVQAPEFAGWFEASSVTGGTVNVNGIAKPADSVNFPDTPNCSFYKWSEQMFLWLTSPAPPSYGGGGGRIFKSPAFYDVSPLDSNFDRTFIPHAPGIFANLSLRAAQVGIHGLPVILDKQGTMFEVERPSLGPTGKQLILNEVGQPVEIERVTLRERGKPIFLDSAGKEILNPKPILRPELDSKLTVQKFTAGQIPVFLNAFGNVVDVEQGQADGSVLMAQTGSLVYYGITVNDVYAYFLTGVKNNQILPGTHFPTTAADLSQITTYAAAHSKTFPDPEALAIEVKTSWVEAASLPNLSSYITINATIPTYNQSNPNVWVPNGQKTVQMALVGIHVVGSTGGSPGHPEMIWATFEHKSNAPDVSYSYVSTSGVKTVNPDFSQSWLFCASNPAGGARFNQAHIQEDSLNPGNIIAVSPFAISPSNTMRVNAWGGAANASPNPVDAPSSPLATAASAASNSEIISTNNSVRGLLNSGDVRNNYIMTGATWTIGGASPTTNFGNPGNSAISTGKAVGTSQMANTTMETYQQLDFALPFHSSFSQFSNNCFSCHSSNTTSVSHIFTTPGHAPHGLKALFP